VRQKTGKLLEIHGQLGLATDHVGGADNRVSGEVIAHGLAIHILPHARLIQVDIDQDLAIHRFPVSIAVG